MTQAKQDKRPAPAPKVRRQRKPHPTEGWFNLGQRAKFKEQA